MAQLMRQRRKQGRYKHDGYRTVPVVERGSARAYTRNGQRRCSIQSKMLIQNLGFDKFDIACLFCR